MALPLRQHAPTISKHALRALQARTAFEQGNVPEAETRSAAILSKRPSDFDALYVMGAIRHQQGRLPEALRFMAKALRANSRSPEALINQSFILAALKRFDDALASYDATVKAWPHFAEAHNGRGCVLLALRRPAEALDSFTKALAAKPAFPDALSNQGNALLHLHRPDEAAAALAQALRLQPNYAAAHYNLGNAFQQMGYPADALASYDRALALQPAYVEAYLNRAVALQELQCPGDALAAIDRALTLKPDHADAHNTRGCLLRQIGRHAEAAASFDAALTIRPNFPHARFNRGLLRLQLGDMARGWADYEARHAVESFGSQHFDAPQWTGAESLDGKSILLHAEQGFGDTIQFCRYAAIVAAMGARVTLQAQPSLKTLLAISVPEIFVVSRGEPVPAFDFHCPLLSLPVATKTTLETVPATVPYLRPTAASVTKWAARILRTKPLRVGLVWSGGGILWSGIAGHKNDRNRSIPLAALAPLLATPDVQFVGLQKGIRPDDETVLQSCPDLLNLGTELGDFDDTAGAIEALDLVISIDTAVAHLAGALGKSVWIMLPAVVDFRWLLDRIGNPWYPSAHLFRQQKLGDWTSVVHDVCAGLNALGTRGA